MKRDLYFSINSQYKYLILILYKRDPHLSAPKQERQLMNSLYCGIDFHKNTCTFKIVKQDGTLVEKATKRTVNTVKYLANYKKLVISIEASGGVNDFVDRLKSSGHIVKIVDPKKFHLVGINGKKTDEKDAAALAEGLRLNFIPEVHHKTKRSREIKSLLVSRELTVNTRVDIFNHIRGILREYGITIPKGKESFLKDVLISINKVENGYIRNTLLALLNTGKELMKEEGEIEQRLHLFTKDDPHIARLRTIPGIGPLTSLAMIAVVDDISRFKNAKAFASYLGLVPKEYSSGDTRMMGSITRSGSEILRRYLIHGARSIMMHAKLTDKDPNKVWAFKTKERVGMNKATVALAHRSARMAFCILRDETSYGEIKENRPSQKNFNKVA